MSILEVIKPQKRLNVIDLLQAAGVDVSQWKNYKGGRPGANPKYCYNWSFEQSGELVAVCFWHHELTTYKNTVAFFRKPKSSTKREPAVRARRSAEFGRNIELAYRQQLPLRAIILERNPKASANGSIVQARMLDPYPWAVVEYDFASGECLLVRGAKPSEPAASAADIELSYFEGKKRRAGLHPVPKTPS